MEEQNILKCNSCDQIILTWSVNGKQNFGPYCDVKCNKCNIKYFDTLHEKRIKDRKNKNEHII